MISAIEATNYLNQQVVVVDRVAQVAFRSNIWLLHLNQKYPKSPLNAVARKGDTNNFPNFSGYFGKRVEITGYITESTHGRLELALTTTNQIKVLGAPHAASTPPPAAFETPGKLVQPEPAKSAVAPQSATFAPAPGSVSSLQDNSGRAVGWVLGFLGFISLVLVTGIFIFWRRPGYDGRVDRPRVALTKSPDGTVTDSETVEAWKQRALAAEAMAGKQGQMLRDKMIPELTEFAKQSLVQGLYAQRHVLLETQRRAQLALAEMEGRLKTVQAPLHERIRAYEKRIAELEKEVESQGEEVRELARATLTLIRQKLEDERENAGIQSRFN